jgi:hypothetical protein
MVENDDLKHGEREYPDQQRQPKLRTAKADHPA